MRGAASACATIRPEELTSWRSEVTGQHPNGRRHLPLPALTKGRAKIGKICWQPNNRPTTRSARASSSPRPRCLARKLCCGVVQRRAVCLTHQLRRRLGIRAPRGPTRQLRSSGGATTALIRLRGAPRELLAARLLRCAPPTALSRHGAVLQPLLLRLALNARSRASWARHRHAASRALSALLRPRAPCFRACPLACRPLLRRQAST